MYLETLDPSSTLDPNWVGQKVTTKTLEVITGPTVPGMEDVDSFYLLILAWERRYGVTIDVASLYNTHGTMWPEVVVSGDYERVFIFVAAQWGSNEYPASMHNFIGMLIGDESATVRWNRGL